MKTIIRDRIIYTGISEDIPEDLYLFTQINMDEVLTIDETLRDIDDIIKVSVTSNIKESNVVQTAIGTSLEGQHLSGSKLLTEGEFFVQINYSANDSSNGIYIYKTKLYFNNATALDKDMSNNSRVIPTIYIEDIYSDKISEREILLNINFIFTVENY